MFVYIYTKSVYVSHVIKYLITCYIYYVYYIYSACITAIVCFDIGALLYVGVLVFLNIHIEKH